MTKRVIVVQSSSPSSRVVKGSSTAKRTSQRRKTETQSICPWQRLTDRRRAPLLQLSLSARHRTVRVFCESRDGIRDSTPNQTNEASKSLFESFGSSSREETFATATLYDAEIETVSPIQESRTEEFSIHRLWLSRRGIVISLCFLAFMLCNMDRVNMSIAILPMAQEFGWDSTQKGIVQSSFFWGYLLTQVLGGIWADKFGGKRILGLGVIWWSLATALTPIAAHLGFPALLLTRACMGIGEGVAMPSMNNLLSKWVPVQERSRSLAFVYSGMFVGSIIGLAVSPHLIQLLSWSSVFHIFGLFGIFWLFSWNQNASSSPQEDPEITLSEQRYILSGKDVKEEAVEIPWRRILSRIEVWTIIVSHFCHNWGTFILLTWMPTYYNQVLGLDLMKSGFFSVLPWITMAVAANVGGWIADSLVPKIGVTRVRKVMQTIGFLGPALFLTQLGKVHSVPVAVGCMMCAQGLDAFSQSGLYSNHQDIGPKYAGVLLGLSNTAGVLAGVLGTYTTGYILHTGSWDQVWQVAVAFQIFGATIWNLFATGERVLD